MPAKPSRAKQIPRYNYAFPAGTPDWQIEMQCWNLRLRTGLPPTEHFRRMLAITSPDVIWNPWMERQIASTFADEWADKVGATTVRNLPWVGPGAAGKTNTAGVWAFYYWLADPTRTSVALTSTSKSKMRQRVWPLIQQCWLDMRPFMEELGDDLPHMLNSTMELQAVKGDSKHAIFGQAVEEGEVHVAVEKLKGVHSPRMVLIIDEAPGTPEAIFGCIPNMLKGCQNATVIPIGNGPMTHFDPFSRVCRPVAGWKAVSVETDEWDTAPMPEFQLPKGRCLHFRGSKSPNVLAGRTLYPFIYTFEDYQRTLRDPNTRRTAAYYSQDEGFWPPEGFLRTVLTEELIEQGGARGAMAFAGATTPIGSLDPGFGGDKCILRFGTMGRLASGKLAVQVKEKFSIPILVDAIGSDGKKLPAEYQIVQFVRPLADERKVKPAYFGVEATGTGRGVAAVMLQEWGEVVAVESGGKPSDLPASEEDERPSHQVYDRRITELWFSVAAFVRGAQLGGLDEDDCEQFCSRLYDFTAKKYILEKKEDLKPRLGRSPDDADSIATLIEVARRHGMATRGPRGDRMLSMWDREIQLQQRLYQPENLYQEEQPS